MKLLLLILLMATKIDSSSIEDSVGVTRQDLNVTDSSKAVIAKAVAGNGVALTSTGPDAGTGDVTFDIVPNWGSPIAGNTTDKTIPQNATTYFGLHGNRAGTAGTGDTTDPSGTAANYNRAFVAPCSGTIRSLFAQLDGACGSGNQIAITVRKNGADTTLTCTISGASATSASDLTNSFTVAAGDLLAIKFVASATLAASRLASWTCEFVPDASAVGDPQTIFLKKTADETVTSSGTIQDDDHLNFAVAANRTYEISGAIQADNASNNIDIKLAFQLPTSASMKVYALGVQNAGGNAVQGSGLMTASNTSKTFLINGGVSTLIQFRGILVIGANSGNVKFRWAQGTSNATGTIVRSGSYMVLRRVA